MAGILFSYVLAVVGVVYGATTWERPHRDVLFALILVAVGASSLLWLPRQRIVRAPWWAAFFCAWSVIDVCVLLELAWLDGGAGSPMALCLVLPLIFSALFYPLWSMVVVGAVTVSGYVLLGVLAGDASPPYVFLVTSLLAMAAAMCVIQSRVHAQQRLALHTIARTDPLTGSLNRRGFEERVAHEVHVAQGTRPFALVLLDLDHFKLFNDNHGHLAGDELLYWMVATSRRVFRTVDAIGRLGGDEFAILLPGAGQAEAEALAGRVLAALAERVPASVGLACHPADGQDYKSLLRQADRSLYASKRARETGEAGIDLSDLSSL